jgi:hypothetical protein
MEEAGTWKRREGNVRGRDMLIGVAEPTEVLQLGEKLAVTVGNGRNHLQRASRAPTHP